MDRLTYVSTYGNDLTRKDIYHIGRQSVVNNTKDNLTGVLMCFKGIFYQILEGEPAPLYRCLDRIKADSRHSDIIILSVEKNLTERLYGQWKMKTMVLDDTTDPSITPLKNLLDLMTRTYRTLEKYVPSEVLEGIQQRVKPTELGLKFDELVVLFSDLVGFSTMMEKINLSDLRNILDSFFSISSRSIDRTGGRMAKLLGDGFMAYYQVADASKAIEAAVSIVSGLAKLRATATSPFLKLAYCGIGISAGQLVRGNIGSAIKKDYTLLGDVVNSASRLESHTRQLGFSILFDHRFRKYLPKQPQISIVRLGDYLLKGKLSKSTLYTVSHPDVAFDRTPQQITLEIKNI